jgi:hypothetical protein
MLTLDPTPDAARAALHGLYGWTRGTGELVEVSIKSPRGKWHSQHWDVDTLLATETIKQLGWWSSQGREVYMGCVGLTGRPAKEWRRGGAALRGRAGALWLDVDCEAPGREGDDYFSTVGQAVDVVDAALGSTLADASLVVGSGWGIQYWIPLAEPVSGAEASRVVRALVGWLTEVTAKQIDRVWDVTRVMRMPGTLNWRAGPDDEDAVPTGILRWPDPARAGRGRLQLANVSEVLGAQVNDVLATDDDADVRVPDADVLDWLLERYALGTDTDTDVTGAPRPPLGEVLGDLDRLATKELDWADVLEPYGWRCTSGAEGRDREQVWERPGKVERGLGERSAVVYADKPELLVVYSDSPSTGFSAGLRGSGRRGDGAGVGVISKFRAWVDLEHAGDVAEARRQVTSGTGEDEVAERLGKAWRSEMSWVTEWGRDRENEALEAPFMTTMTGNPDP